MNAKKLDVSLLLELLLGMAEGVIVTDESGRIELFNSAAERLFGYKSADVVGQHLEMLIPEGSRARHQNLIEEFAGGKSDRMLMVGRPDVKSRHKNGTEFPIKASISRIVHLGRKHFVSIVMDQSEQERLEDAKYLLAESHRIARMGSWEWDTKTGALSWSEEMYGIFQVDPQSTKLTIEFFHSRVHRDDRDRLRHVPDMPIIDSQASTVNYRIVRPSGEIRTLYESNEWICDDHGIPIRIIGVVQDISERVQIESQLRQSQKLEAVGHLAGGIAHDFNNLLMVIQGNLELASLELMDAPAFSRLNEEIAEATNAAERGVELTQRLLAFSRQQDIHLEAVDVARLITDMGLILLRTLGERVEVKVNIDDSLWRCTADASQLGNVLLNLAINAHDAMPDGGKLIIEASNASLDDEFIIDHPDANPGQYVLLCVSDTGCGIRPEIIRQVFDPFFTTKEQGRGSGLGLSMVYGFVRQSGGWVDLDSAIGTGTTVRIYLPRSTGVADEVSLSVEPQGAGECILVVDDDPGVRKLTVKMLRQLGYRTLQAEDANEALKIIRRTPDIALLLTDILLPGGRDGTELVELARQEWPQLKLLYISGFAGSAIVNQARLDHNIEILNKPFTKQKIARMVRAALLRV